MIHKIIFYDVMSSISINEPCYGVLCHRQYVDRVSNALLAVDDEWVTIYANEDACPSRVLPAKQSSILIPTVMEKGPRKSRTGYSLLVLQNCVMSPAALPPTARRQLSWAGRLSQRTEIKGSFGEEEQIVEVSTTGQKRTRSIERVDERIDSYLEIIDTVTAEIWRELTNKGFDIESDVLRIDAHPKAINSNSYVCLAMQQSAKKVTPLTTNGPIKLALSASFATTVVSVVFSSQKEALWGISTNKEHFEELNQRLNDYATKEVAVEATDSKSGLDKSSLCELPSILPVSRAYYKLAQVFEDKNLLDKIASLRGIEGKDNITKHVLLSHGSGLDVGASPGGWTQVLCNQLCIPTVAVDPAVLAKRVKSLNGVTHIRSELSSKEAIMGIAQHAPYSTIVCDACMSNPKALFQKIIEVLERILTLLKESGNDRGVVTWPLCTVFTLKFPHKTSGSIDRHIGIALEALPDYFRRLATLGSLSQSVDVRYKICHLFANSLSERTVIALLHKSN